ncbi:HPr family phosphocarrier protein [Marinobacter sp. CHS3-4]|uniref:HPr family phosphocarrier protein n=1 Tax=Marinobacter sp. CHS3-4 TaxID=3045174 RepID=UPI0024B58497|nr:HPr family phosphocarrier protein [Marinobacter sp. CHS3-4]MDI9244924.1 HPr family phosphocarrier protein [Marinobacter sp. CHS3-4]
MIRRTTTIINKLGLHARAAAKLVATASKFDSVVTIARDGREVSAKSIMPVMMLAASQGVEVELIVDGDDEAEAMEAIVALIEDYFGEGE